MTSPGAGAAAAGRSPIDVAALRAGGAPWILVPAWQGDGDAELSDEAQHHLRRVRRRGDGDDVVVTDGAGTVAGGRLDGAVVRVGALAREQRQVPLLRVVQGIGTRGKHDLVVRMLTEVGVDEIVGVTCVRSESRPAHKAGRVRARWTAVADAAVGQSRRSIRPAIAGPMELEEALAAVAPGDVALVADPTSTTSPVTALCDLDGSATTVHLVVGPEAGLTADERAMLARRGATRVSLGRSVLRTEHAALVLAGVAGAALGRMGPTT